MKIKKIAACLAVAIGIPVLTGCSHGQSAQLENEITVSLDNISEVTISYDEEKVTFYESGKDELVIKEYMTKNKNRYHAKVEQSGSHMKIREGGKPLFQDGFCRYIEVYLPASYHENLTVTTTDGDIDISRLELSLHALRIDCTAGTVRIHAVEAQSLYLSTTSGVLDAGHLNADTIRIATTSGHFFCEKLEGNVTYTTTSGSTDIKSALGLGTYKANQSGELNIIYTEVTGDLSFYNKNDGIHVTLPADLEFAFEATTKNGSVSTTFPENVFMDGRTTSGTVGEHPTVTVKAETNNGNIQVEQGSGMFSP